MKVIAMIPARLGSQRLKQKNMQLLQGIPLIVHAIRKAKSVGLFDEVWVNSEAEVLGKLAQQEGVGYHERPKHLANDQATSEDFVYEFLKGHPCDFVVQVHSIAPLLSVTDTVLFTEELIKGSYDVLLSTELVQIECAYQNSPVNFTFDCKTNSQELEPVQRVTWSITGWRRSTYLAAYEAGCCATYAGRVGFFPISKLASHIIKTKEDLDIAEVLLNVMDQVSRP